MLLMEIFIYFYLFSILAVLVFHAVFFIREKVAFPIKRIHLMGNEIYILIEKR